MNNHQWFLCGWAFGAAMIWFHFRINGLLRTREEWLNRKKKKGSQ